MNTINDFEDPIRTANEVLSAVPGRRTRGRTYVLAALISGKRAMSHTEIEMSLPPDVAMDRVTLYRVLEWLTENGLTHRVSGADRAVRFAYTQNAGVGMIQEAQAHAHFQCDQCRRVECLDSVKTTIPAAPAGYHATWVDMLVHGVCARCSSSTKPTIRREHAESADPR